LRELSARRPRGSAARRPQRSHRHREHARRTLCRNVGSASASRRNRGQTKPGSTGEAAMIAVIADIIGMTVIGLPITLAIDRDARGGSLVGLSFLYGSGAVSGVMLLLPWYPPLIVGALMVIAGATWWSARRPRRASAAEVPSTALGTSGGATD